MQAKKPPFKLLRSIRRAAVGNTNSAGRAGTVMDQEMVSRLVPVDKRGRLIWSWAYIRAVIDDVRVISATREIDEIRIEYRYDYTAYCACKNLNASDSHTDQLSCKIREGNIVLPEFVQQERSTFEEF